MPRDLKTAHLSIAAYRAQFTPRAPQAEVEIIVISDDEEDPMIMEDASEDVEESMATIVVNSVLVPAIPAGMPRAAAQTRTQEVTSHTRKNSGHLGSFRPFRQESKFLLCRYR
jgi:hypothetical protein